MFLGTEKGFGRLKYYLFSFLAGTMKGLDVAGVRLADVDGSGLAAEMTLVFSKWMQFAFSFSVLVRSYRPGGGNQLLSVWYGERCTVHVHSHDALSRAKSTGWTCAAVACADASAHIMHSRSVWNEAMSLRWTCALVACANASVR